MVEKKHKFLQSWWMKNVYPQETEIFLPLSSGFSRKMHIRIKCEVTHLNQSTHTLLKFRNLNYHQIYKSLTFIHLAQWLSESCLISQLTVQGSCSSQKEKCLIENHSCYSKGKVPLLWKWCILLLPPADGNVEKYRKTGVHSIHLLL